MYYINLQPLLTTTDASEPRGLRRRVQDQHRALFVCMYWEGGALLRAVLFSCEEVDILVSFQYAFNICCDFTQALCKMSCTCSTRLNEYPIFASLFVPRRILSPYAATATHPCNIIRRWWCCHRGPGVRMNQDTKIHSLFAMSDFNISLAKLSITAHIYFQTYYCLE